MAEAHRRHDLLDVEPGAWAAAVIARADLAEVPHVAAWVNDGRPVILRRSHPGEDAGRVPVGLPLLETGDVLDIASGDGVNVPSTLSAPTPVASAEQVPTFEPGDEEN